MKYFGLNIHKTLFSNLMHPFFILHTSAYGTSILFNISCITYSVVISSASASYVTAILWRKTSRQIPLTSSGIMYPLRLMNAIAFAPRARFIDALGEAPYCIISFEVLVIFIIFRTLFFRSFAIGTCFAWVCNVNK